MLNMVLSGLIGALVSMALATGVELWKGRGRRRLYGEWWCAVQPVYYQTEKWHIQKLSIKPSLFGIVIDTAKKDGKLQWRMHADLKDQKYLVGRWKSLRAGSISSGYMSLQISLNGEFMCGHNYGDVGGNQNANFGVLLLGRSESLLMDAWKAAAAEVRHMVSLDKSIDYHAADIGESGAQNAITD